MTRLPFGPGRRDALLIATGTYEDRALSTLRSPGQDCAGLAGVLDDPRIGGFHTEQLRDARAHEAMRALERFFRDRSRDDLLLLHVSCHGIKDDDGRLYFATRDTDRDLPASTAIPAAFLRDRMDRCRARTIIVLLDCCYSGAFLPGAKGDDRIHVRDELGGHGIAVLTATSRTEYAWEGERVESKVPQPSRFTGALIEGLRTGAADLNRDGRITVTELYDYVYEYLHRSGARQRPRMWADLEYQVTVARTVAAQENRTAQENQAFEDAMDAFFQEPDFGRAQPQSSEQQTAPEPEATADPWAYPDPETEAEWGTGTGPGTATETESEQHYPRTRAYRGQDALIRLELDLSETAFGTQKDIVVDTAIVCPTCSGPGTAPGTHPRTCDACDGRGTAGTSWRGSRGGTGATRPCRTCDGYGTLLPHPCPECAGDGRVRSRRTLTVKIPAGVDHGTRIQLAGEGEAGAGGGEAAHLYLELQERRHPVFRRTHDDLHRTLTVPRALATKGGTLPIRTLDGSHTIRIPRGLRDGQTMRLAGLGVPHLRESGRGDLLAHVEIRD
ncbi:DnaJ C-terminal domain-containing protein [Streptomyces sp. NPDC006012]|uniref:caspase, EACC1-associated type n=1 Tax=Streptomyces sp. NPDC006012 TaxID=3364739 RepID=UPI0036740B0A